MENLQAAEQNPHRLVNKEGISYANQIVVATNCLYRNYRALYEGEQRSMEDTDGVRGDLALELFKKATGVGVRVVVCDGGSSADFQSALEGFKDHGLMVVGSDVLPGRGPQRRSVFEAAAKLTGGRVIVYTQAEKSPLLNNFPEICKPILEDGADIVIPSRNSELFEQTYPRYMKDSEIKVKNTYNRLMKRYGLLEETENFDWFFGPVAFKNDPEIVSLFLKRYELKASIRSRRGAQPNPELHSNAHYFPIIEALFKRKRVISVETSFEYPRLQRINEESPEKIVDFMERRQKDADAYRLEAIHFLAFLRGDPGSKIKEVTSLP